MLCFRKSEAAFPVNLFIIRCPVLYEKAVLSAAELDQLPMIFLRTLAPPPNPRIPHRRLPETGFNTFGTNRVYALSARSQKRSNQAKDGDSAGDIRLIRLYTLIGVLYSAGLCQLPIPAVCWTTALLAIAANKAGSSGAKLSNWHYIDNRHCTSRTVERAPT